MDDGGAAWVFTRSAGTWTQQAKLRGSGGYNEGWAVALSADGNVAALTAPPYMANGVVSNGGVWMFTRSGAIWSQQGNELRAVGDIEQFQGTSVHLLADGSAMLVTGIDFNPTRACMWIFKQSGGVWTQYGSDISTFSTVTIQLGSGFSADGTVGVIMGLANAVGTPATGIPTAWVYENTNGTWVQRGGPVSNGVRVPTPPCRSLFRATARPY